MVECILEGTAAAEAGVSAGDVILTLDGHPLHDVIDYQFYLEPRTQTLEISRNGLELELELEYDGACDPGIIFDSVIFDRIRTCANRCVFCFIDQVPAGLRPPLYFKDDDFRLSFLYGNFITLGNLGEEDLRRIADQRLSPLYVSLHATDPVVRSRLMGSSQATAARGLDNLRRLGEAGIKTHMQIVLCPGINDGDVLERSVIELATDYAGVASVGVVPVAISEERLRRDPDPGLRAVNEHDCDLVVDAIAMWQERYRRERGNGFIYAADEFFLRIGRQLPPADYYDDFAQYENGIGIARTFLDEGQSLIADAIACGPGSSTAGDKAGKDGRRAFLLTGRLSAELMNGFCKRASAALGYDIRPLVAANHLFGEHVTVAGLLGGRDILGAARAARLGRGDLLIIPPSVLENAGEAFLDDFTIEELDESLDCDIVVARL